MLLGPDMQCSGAEMEDPISSASPDMFVACLDTDKFVQPRLPSYAMYFIKSARDP